MCNLYDKQTNQPTKEPTDKGNINSLAEVITANNSFPESEGWLRAIVKFWYLKYDTVLDPQTPVSAWPAVVPQTKTINPEPAHALMEQKTVLSLTSKHGFQLHRLLKPITFQINLILLLLSWPSFCWSSNATIPPQQKELEKSVDKRPGMWGYSLKS